MAWRILAYLKRRKQTAKVRIFGPGKLNSFQIPILAAVQVELTQEISWIENISKRANKRKGGLGKR